LYNKTFLMMVNRLLCSRLWKGYAMKRGCMNIKYDKLPTDARFCESHIDRLRVVVGEYLQNFN